MLIIDIESTGIASSFYSVPCEIAIIYAQEDRIIDSYSSLIQPPQYFERFYYDGLKKSSVFHKIDQKMIEKDGKPIVDVASDVYEFIKKYSIQKNSHIYAWNFNSDKVFLLKLFMFAEFVGGIEFVNSLSWKEMMPKYKTGLDRFMKKDIYDYAGFILRDKLELKTLWEKQYRHRAFFDTIMQYAIMLKYTNQSISML